VDNLSVRRVRQSSLGERVAHELRVLVVTGELRSGTHLVEGVLAERFDVSRGPVRDALRELEAEGLVESRRRGLFVKGLTGQDIDELYSLRAAMETLALSLAMERAGSADWAPAERCVQRMTEAAERSDVREFAAADLEFHSCFYELSGHRRLASVWEQYRPTFQVVLDVTNSQDADLRRPAEDHARLLACARSGDTERAAETLRAHLKGAQERLRSALGPGPDPADG